MIFLEASLHIIEMFIKHFNCVIEYNNKRQSFLIELKDQQEYYCFEANFNKTISCYFLNTKDINDFSKKVTMNINDLLEINNCYYLMNIIKPE